MKCEVRSGALSGQVLSTKNLTALLSAVSDSRNYGI
jgi:hypothetical protein